jgi:hypothetical protein
MKKKIASIAASVFLGIVVMLMPILATTQLLGSPEPNTLGTAEGERGGSSASSSWKTLDDAAQTLGQMDTGPAPFPTSVTHTILLAGTSFIVALVTSLAMKSRIKLAVQDLILRNQAEKW